MTLLECRSDGLMCGLRILSFKVHKRRLRISAKSGQIRKASAQKIALPNRRTSFFTYIKLKIAPLLMEDQFRMQAFLKLRDVA